MIRIQIQVRKNMIIHESLSNKKYMQTKMSSSLNDSSSFNIRKKEKKEEKIFKNSYAVKKKNQLI